MSQFSALLRNLKQIEAAALADDWQAVKRQSQTLEQVAATVAKGLVPASMIESDRIDFSNVKDLHQRILCLVQQHQDQVKHKLTSLSKNTKASRAYGENKQIP